jgi:hypothetical protein
MMRNALIFIFLIWITGYGCMNYSEKDKVTGDMEKIQVFFSNLPGKWVMEDQPLIEEWERDGSLFRSTVYTIRYQDTIVSETVRIIEKDGSIFYEANVRGQNQDQPVLFKLSQVTDNKVVFVNPVHDFPQQITYEKNGQDKVLATIQGNDEGKIKSFEFKFSKLK